MIRLLQKALFSVYALVIVLLPLIVVAAPSTAYADPIITDYPITTGYSFSNHPQDIVAGSDGALWFTNPTPGFIGRVTTQGEFTSYTQKKSLLGF